MNPADFSWILYRDGQSTPLRIARADTAVRRMRGLLGTPRLVLTHGLWLSPCNSVHTAFMGYAIDVVFVAGDGRVVAVRHALAPWRLAWGGWRARHTLELAAGVALEHRLVSGVRVELVALKGGEQ